MTNIGQTSEWLTKRPMWRRHIQSTLLCGYELAPLSCCCAASAHKNSSSSMSKRVWYAADRSRTCHLHQNCITQSLYMIVGYLFLCSVPEEMSNRQRWHNPAQCHENTIADCCTGHMDACWRDEWCYIIKWANDCLNALNAPYFIGHNRIWSVWTFVEYSK